MTKTLKCAIGALVAAPLIPFGALAAQETEEASPYEKCASITDDSGRLACFDTTFAQEKTQRAERLAAQEQQAEEQFGLSAVQVRERAEAAGEKVPEADDAKVTATVLEIYVERRSKLRRFLLDNGQLWAETSSSTSLRRAPKEGQQVTISKEALGAFKLRVEGKNGFMRVKRLR